MSGRAHARVNACGIPSPAGFPPPYSIRKGTSKARVLVLMGGGQDAREGRSSSRVQRKRLRLSRAGAPPRLPGSSPTAGPPLRRCDMDVTAFKIGHPCRPRQPLGTEGARRGGPAPGRSRSPLRARVTVFCGLPSVFAGDSCQETLSLRANAGEGTGGRAPARRLRGRAPQRGRERRAHGPQLALSPGNGLSGRCDSSCPAPAGRSLLPPGQ